MSTKISKKRFIEILKKLIRQEIAEVSTTGTAGTYPGGPGHYYTPHAFSSGSVGSKNPEVGGYKKVNEVKFAVTIDMGKLGQGKVLVDAGSKGMAKTMVAKKLKQGLKGVISVSRVQPSLGKQVDRKIENVNEVTKQEVNALRNLVKGIGNLKKDFSKAAYIGDKELRKKDYNKHYETLLDAEKAMVKLMQLFKNKEMLGEGLNEGKNDKILDKIADIVKGASSFMNIGRELDKNRIKYTFGTKMIPMYIIEKPVKIVIINKKYVSGAERVVGSTAIGVMESIKESINEGRYHDWRNDESLTPKQKIGRSIREVRNSLNELNKTINMNLKLKTELQVDSRDYWKTTHKALSGISEKLVKLAGKVGNLK